MFRSIMNIHEIGSVAEAAYVSPAASPYFYFSIIIASWRHELAAVRCSARRLSILSDHLYLMKSHKDTRTLEEGW